MIPPPEARSGTVPERPAFGNRRCDCKLLASSSRCCDATSTKTVSNVNIVGYQPRCQTMPQIVSAPALDGVARAIKVTGTKKLSIFIPFLDCLRHTRPGRCRIQIRLTGNAAAAGLCAFELRRREDPIAGLAIDSGLMPLQKVTSENRVHRDRRSAVNVLAGTDLIDPTTPDDDAISVVLDIPPLQSESLANT
jgi:hypothetical protein